MQSFAVHTSPLNHLRRHGHHLIFWAALFVIVWPSDITVTERVMVTTFVLLAMYVDVRTFALTTEILIDGEHIFFKNTFSQSKHRISRESTVVAVNESGVNIGFGSKNLVVAAGVEARDELVELITAEINRSRGDDA